MPSPLDCVVVMHDRSVWPRPPWVVSLITWDRESLDFIVLSSHGEEEQAVAAGRSEARKRRLPLNHYSPTRRGRSRVHMWTWDGKLIDSSP